MVMVPSKWFASFSELFTRALVSEFKEKPEVGCRFRNRLFWLQTYMDLLQITRRQSSPMRKSLRNTQHNKRSQHGYNTIHARAHSTHKITPQQSHSTMHTAQHAHTTHKITSHHAHSTTHAHNTQDNITIRTQHTQDNITTRAQHNTTTRTQHNTTSQHPR